jgi:hypothetical protein
MKYDQLEIVAIHEAGHATVCCCLSPGNVVCPPKAHFDLIAIRNPEEVSAGPAIAGGRSFRGSGFIQIPRFYSDYPRVIDMPPEFEFVAKRCREHAMMDIIVALAGPMAEARFRSCTFDSLVESGQGGRGDWECALKIANCIDPSPGRAEQLCIGLKENAREVLNHPCVWATVEALAKTLLKRQSKRLTGKQAFPIMKRAFSSVNDEYRQ